jgi:hypothetical protein
MPMARKRRARIETRLESPAEAIRRPGGQKCLPRQMSLHGELILWLAWSYQDLGRKEGLSPRGKTRHDVRAYLMTYLKEFYMKLKIRQQAGLRSFEHSSRLGGPFPWGGRRGNRFSMGKWLRLGGSVGQSDSGSAVRSENSTTPRGGRPQKFSWEDIWIETCRYIHYEGLPPTAAGLMRHLQQYVRIRLVNNRQTVL